jgi:hypothetical protein
MTSRRVREKPHGNIRRQRTHEGKCTWRQQVATIAYIAKLEWAGTAGVDLHLTISSLDSCYPLTPPHYTNSTSISQSQRDNGDGYLHRELPEDYACIEEAEKESSELGPTGLSNPERGDREHHSNGDTCWEPVSKAQKRGLET